MDGAGAGGISGDSTSGTVGIVVIATGGRTGAASASSATASTTVSGTIVFLAVSNELLPPSDSTPFMTTSSSTNGALAGAGGVAGATAPAGGARPVDSRPLPRPLEDGRGAYSTWTVCLAAALRFFAELGAAASEMAVRLLLRGGVSVTAARGCMGGVGVEMMGTSTTGTAAAVGDEDGASVMTTSSRSVSGPLAGADMEGDIGGAETACDVNGLVDP